MKELLDPDNYDRSQSLFSLVINPQKDQERVLNRARFDFVLTLKLTKIAKQPWSIFGQESSKTHGTLCHSLRNRTKIQSLPQENVVLE